MKRALANVTRPPSSKDGEQSGRGVVLGQTASAMQRAGLTFRKRPPKLPGFHIPRKNKEQRPLFTPVSKVSREFGNILNILDSHYLDAESKETFLYSNGRLVHSELLERDFMEKRRELKLDGRTEQELEVTHCFMLCDLAKVPVICERGLCVGQSWINILGNSSKGVYLSKYSDLLQITPLNPGISGEIIIFKVMKGKVKGIYENMTKGILDPTPKFDSHVCKNAGKATSLTAYRAYEFTQQYFYEYDFDELKTRPRQVCPFAVISFQFKAKDAPLQTTPLVPLRLNRQLSEATKERSSYTVWSGELVMGDEIGHQVFCQVDLRSYSPPFLPFKLPEKLGLGKAMNLDQLCQRIPSALFSANLYAGSHEVVKNNMYGSLLEVVDKSRTGDRIGKLLHCMETDNVVFISTLRDQGFFILLSSIQMAKPTEREGVKQCLQALFIYQESRDAARNSSKCSAGQRPTPSAVMSWMDSLIPALHYALVRVGCNPQRNPQADISAAVEQQAREFLSGRKDDKIHPMVEYDCKLDDRGKLFPAPKHHKVNMEGCLRSYVYSPILYHLAVAKAQQMVEELCPQTSLGPSSNGSDLPGACADPQKVQALINLVCKRKEQALMCNMKQEESQGMREGGSRLKRPSEEQEPAVKTYKYLKKANMERGQSSIADESQSPPTLSSAVLQDEDMREPAGPAKLLSLLATTLQSMAASAKRSERGPAGEMEPKENRDPRRRPSVVEQEPQKTPDDLEEQTACSMSSTEGFSPSSHSEISRGPVASGRDDQEFEIPWVLTPITGLRRAGKHRQTKKGNPQDPRVHRTLHQSTPLPWAASLQDQLATDSSDSQSTNAQSALSVVELTGPGQSSAAYCNFKSTTPLLAEEDVQLYASNGPGIKTDYLKKLEQREQPISPPQFYSEDSPLPERSSSPPSPLPSEEDSSMETLQQEQEEEKSEVFEMEEEGTDSMPLTFSSSSPTPPPSSHVPGSVDAIVEERMDMLEAEKKGTLLLPPPLSSISPPPTTSVPEGVETLMGEPPEVFDMEGAGSQLLPPPLSSSSASPPPRTIVPEDVETTIEELPEVLMEEKEEHAEVLEEGERGVEGARSQLLPPPISSSSLSPPPSSAVPEGVKPTPEELPEVVVVETEEHVKEVRAGSQLLPSLSSSLTRARAVVAVNTIIERNLARYASENTDILEAAGSCRLQNIPVNLVSRNYSCDTYEYYEALSMDGYVNSLMDRCGSSLRKELAGVLVSGNILDCHRNQVLGPWQQDLANTDNCDTNNGAAMHESTTRHNHDSYPGPFHVHPPFPDSSAVPLSIPGPAHTSNPVHESSTPPTSLRPQFSHSPVADLSQLYLPQAASIVAASTQNMDRGLGKPEARSMAEEHLVDEPLCDGPGSVSSVKPEAAVPWPAKGCPVLGSGSSASNSLINQLRPELIDQLEPELVDDLAEIIKNLRRNASMVVQRNTVQFYIHTTEENQVYDNIREHLLRLGNVERSPMNDLDREDSMEKLFIVIQNKDIADQIHKIPALVSLKQRPSVVFAGVDSVEDIKNNTYHELFVSGGFIVSDEFVLNPDFITHERLRALLMFLESQSSPESLWRWKIHCKTQKKLKEQARFKKDARNILEVLTTYQKKQIVEFLPYHDCDMSTRQTPDLECLIRLQAQHVQQHRHLIFLTERRFEMFPNYLSSGITIANIDNIMHSFHDLCGDKLPLTDNPAAEQDAEVGVRVCQSDAPLHSAEHRSFPYSNHGTPPPNQAQDFCLPATPSDSLPSSSPERDFGPLQGLISHFKADKKARALGLDPPPADHPFLPPKFNCPSPNRQQAVDATLTSLASLHSQMGITGSDADTVSNKSSTYPGPKAIHGPAEIGVMGAGLESDSDMSLCGSSIYSSPGCRPSLTKLTVSPATDRLEARGEQDILSNANIPDSPQSPPQSISTGNPSPVRGSATLQGGLKSGKEGQEVASSNSSNQGRVVPPHSSTPAVRLGLPNQTAVLNSLAFQHRLALPPPLVPNVGYLNTHNFPGSMIRGLMPVNMPGNLPTRWPAGLGPHILWGFSPRPLGQPHRASLMGNYTTQGNGFPPQRGGFNGL